MGKLMATPANTPASAAANTAATKAPLTSASVKNAPSNALVSVPPQPTLTSIKVEGSVPLEMRTKQMSTGDIFMANLPFMVTIFVVVAAAIVNYFVNRKTINNQDKNSRLGRQADHQNTVSEYRHAWLQEVRDTAAELIKTVYEAQHALMMWNLTRGYRDEGGSDEKMKEWNERLPVLYLKEKEAAAEMYKYTAKLKLLFKKNDQQVVRLFTLLDATLNKVGNLDLVRIEEQTIAEIVGELQVVLKNEWEVTKSRILNETGG